MNGTTMAQSLFIYSTICVSLHLKMYHSSNYNYNNKDSMSYSHLDDHLIT